MQTCWDGWFSLASVDDCLRPALGHRRNPDLQGLRRGSIWCPVVGLMLITQSVVRLKSNTEIGHPRLTLVFTPKLDSLFPTLHLTFCRSSWWQGWSVVEFHMPWVCAIDFLEGCCRNPSQNLHRCCTAAPAIHCTVWWCCSGERSGPCILVHFENLVALVWVTGPPIQRSAWWWAWVGPCWGQTEGWLLSSCFQGMNLQENSFHMRVVYQNSFWNTGKKNLEMAYYWQEVSTVHSVWTFLILTSVSIAKLLAK